MIKIRFWTRVPRDLRYEINPEKVDLVEVVDDSVNPMTADQEDFNLDEDVLSAVRIGDEVFVYADLEGYCYPVPDHLVKMIPQSAFEDYDQAMKPMPG